MRTEDRNIKNTIIRNTNIDSNRSTVNSGFEKMGNRSCHHRKPRSVRRARICQLQRKAVLAFGAVLLLICGVLLGSNIFGASSSNASDGDMLYKYYTSVEVQPGDTLWTIADKYMQDETDRADYIQELKEMNHLQNDSIHAGDYLTVAYYSHEFK